jgi:hypothetical protein
MLNLRHVPIGPVWPELRPIWSWRVCVSGWPERHVCVRATKQWGAIVAGAQELGVDPSDVEAELLPTK